MFYCQFCNGRGCLHCDVQKEKLRKAREAEYQRQFPDGPKPIFTATLATHDELSRMNDEGCPNDPKPQDIITDTVSRMSVEDTVELGELLRYRFKT